MTMPMEEGHHPEVQGRQPLWLGCSASRYSNMRGDYLNDAQVDIERYCYQHFTGDGFKVKINTI